MWATHRSRVQIPSWACDWLVRVSHPLFPTNHRAGVTHTLVHFVVKFIHYFKAFRPNSIKHNSYKSNKSVKFHVAIFVQRMLTKLNKGNERVLWVWRGQCYSYECIIIVLREVVEWGCRTKPWMCSVTQICTYMSQERIYRRDEEANYDKAWEAFREIIYRKHGNE